MASSELSPCCLCTVSVYLLLCAQGRHLAGTEMFSQVVALLQTESDDPDFIFLLPLQAFQDLLLKITSS